MSDAGVTRTDGDAPVQYKRILLKLSGEALLGDRQYGVDPGFCAFIAGQVATVHKLGVQVGVRVGPGVVAVAVLENELPAVLNAATR